jgi:hypothetical protein
MGTSPYSNGRYISPEGAAYNGWRATFLAFALVLEPLP